MATIGLTTRDVARELARRYSTMTHEELDVLEGILVPKKFQKGEIILHESSSTRVKYVKASTGWQRDSYASSITRMVRN